MPSGNEYMSHHPYDDIGKFVLRVALGSLILMHGIAKLTGGVSFIAKSVAAVGLPSFLAYGVYLGEVVAPLLLIAGLYTRLAALVIAINMLFAVGLIHTTEMFAIGESGGWALELQGMYLVTAVAVALLGSGRFSIDARLGSRRRTRRDRLRT